MQAARVLSWGTPPQLTNLPALPEPQPNQLRVKVVAVGVPRVAQARASGNHLSSKSASLPFDPSVDGVVKDESSGQLFYSSTIGVPYLAECANINRDVLIPIKGDFEAPFVAGAANPTLSGWMAMRCRYKGELLGKTVLLVGATTASGRAAAQTARMLGAAKVVGVGRSARSLATVKGLDEHVLIDNESVTFPSSVGPVHLVLDWVGWPLSVKVIQALSAPPDEDCQYILIGGLSGEPNLVLPTAIFNTKKIRITGSGIGSLSPKDLAKETPALVDAIRRLDKTTFDIQVASMADIAQVWEQANSNGKRLVIQP